MSEELLRCYNLGCGKEYKESENKQDSCTYHAGEPVFHDALKGWSCCNRKVTDFTEFLNIKGCVTAKHSNVKIEKPVKEKTIIDNSSIDHKQNTHRKPETKEVEPRPCDSLPYERLKVKVLDSLKKALEKNKCNTTATDKDETDNGVVHIGTSCKNNACDSTYKDVSSDREKCLFHPGAPVFHEGYKYWSCCVKRTSDFDEFLKQQGCETGNHNWFLTDEQKKKAVACRFDHYQMGSFVIISVYAKLCDPEKCYVEANQTCIRAEFVFGKSSQFKMDVKLFGVINPEQSVVALSQTKAEIKLKRNSASNWPTLEYKEPKA